MKIQSVEKYKGSTLCVLFEDGRRLYVNREIAREYGFSAGAEVTLALVREAKNASDLRRAKERALYLLTSRDHSYRELYDKLEKNYPEAVCFEICNKMTGMGFLNDARYAEKLARELLEVRQFGFYRVRQEMRRKGLDDESIASALEPYEDSVQERLILLVRRKYLRYLGDEKGTQKVKAALVRMGYGYSDIREVLTRLEQDEEE